MPVASGGITRIVAGVATVLACALGAASAASGADEQRAHQVVVGGRTVTEIEHVDDPRFGQTAAFFEQSSGPVDGAITDPSLRRREHFQATVDGLDAAPEPRGGAPVTPAANWCSPGTETTTDDIADERTTLPRYKLIYAYASDQPDHLLTGSVGSRYADLMQQAATNIANKISASDGGLKAPRFDYGTSCGAQYVDITTVRLPHPQSYYASIAKGIDRIGAVRADFDPLIAGLHLEKGLWNYLIFADDVSPANAPAGGGYVYDDDMPGPTNANNQGGREAILAGTGASYFQDTSSDYLMYGETHEVGHTLGAVMSSAPHSTGAGHCTDGRAIMCYNDGGPNGAAYTVTSGCTGGANAASYANVAFDCGNDDYLSASPAPSSYLSTHWNEFSNQFMCDTNTCTGSTLQPTATLAAAAPAPAGSTTVLTATASDRDGQVVDYKWDLDNAGTFATDTGSTPSLPVTLDHAGSHVVRVRAVDNDGLTGDSSPLTVTFTDRPPVAALTAPPSAQTGQVLTLSAAASGDPDNGDRITSYVFSDDRGFRVSTNSALAAYKAPATPGAVNVSVTVTDAAGQSGTASVPIVVSSPPPVVPPKSTDSGPTGRGSVLSIKAAAGGKVKVAILCSKTGTGCSGSIVVRVGKHTRDTTYRLKPGQRVTKTLSTPKGVHVTRHSHPSASVQVNDFRGKATHHTVHLRR